MTDYAMPSGIDYLHLYYSEASGRGTALTHSSAIFWAIVTLTRRSGDRLLAPEATRDVSRNKQHTIHPFVSCIQADIVKKFRFF